MEEEAEKDINEVEKSTSRSIQTPRLEVGNAESYLARGNRRRGHVGQALYGPHDGFVSYLIVAIVCLSPSIYYRRLWKKSQKRLTKHIETQWQWNDWGE